MAPPSRARRQVVVELPPPPAEKWRWTSLSPVKVKREEEEDEVVLTGARFVRKQPIDQPDSDVKVKLEETAEELKFKEKKVKVEPAALVLSEDGLKRRLGRLPHNLFETTLTVQEQEHTIPRQLFTDHYEGGHNQFTFFNVRGRALGQQWIQMMCPNRVMNPYSPRIPGAHGLFMDAGIADDPQSDDEAANVKDEKPVKSEATLANAEESATPAGEEKKAVKPDIDDKKKVFSPRLVILAHICPNHWRYVGHYDMIPSEPLSPAEWQQQTAKFKNKWTSVVFREHSCYSLRRGVWHRKKLRAELRRDPTKEEVRAAIEPLSRPELVGLTPRDIEVAFENAELRIYIDAMCFVEYREEFQKDLIRISVHPEPRVKKRRPKKRKRAVSDDDDDDDDDD